MIPEPKSFFNTTPEFTVDAALSKAVYKGEDNVLGWKIDKELSNQNRSVYSKGTRAKVVYRGTNLKNNKTRFDDLGTDFLILSGFQDQGTRFKNAQKTAEAAILKYGKENVSLTGHSLGGSQSAWVSRKTGLKATGFNAGWGLRDPLKNRTYDSFTNITASGDIVSVLGDTNKKMKHVKIYPSQDHPHGINNFVDYDFGDTSNRVMSSAHEYTPREFNITDSFVPTSVYS